jgi:hypothetical protein
MTDLITKEIDAIKAVLTALEPLAPDVRSSVIEYVAKRLGIGHSPIPVTAASVSAAPTSQALTLAAQPVAPSTPVHIKTFKEQKKPRSANEMAALVAYFLGEVAPQDQRKSSISAKDIQTYFKIAEFPLPEQVRVTLPNAKQAGYFDSVGDGEYRLNAVGHNLVAHSMPRGSNAQQAMKQQKRGTRRAKAKRSQ